MGTDFEQIAQVFMQKKEGFKEQIKQLKGALKETVGQMQKMEHDMAASANESGNATVEVQG